MPDSAPAPAEFERRVLAGLNDPYPVYRAYLRAGALHPVPPPGPARRREWLVLGHEEAVVVLAGRGFGRETRPPGGAGSADDEAPGPVPPGYPRLAALLEDWLTFMDPPRHTRVRSVVAGCLARRMRTGVRARLRENVQGVVERLAKEPEFDLVEEYAAALPVLAVLDVLGVPEADQEWLRGQVARLRPAASAAAARRDLRGTGLAIAERAAGALTEYFRTALARRRREPRRDLLTLLLAAPWEEDLAGGPAGEDLLVATCVHLLSAGHETAAAALAKSALLLLRDPELLTGLRARREMTAAAADEFIRFDPPVQAVCRWAQQDEDLAGHRIARGEKVTVVLGAANRDPAAFTEPDSLRFDRDGHRHLGFGMGGHYCLGAALARAVLETGIDGLLDLLPGLSPPAGPLPYRDDLACHGPLSLPVTRVV
ncbi:cytochrome P450 [Streptomyces marincola]|uniref:Cytochrome P450 n=1 Tax=Streptomyces marincola TaxID=2878388 RepID=A0A1W7D4V9_9ACTN|nr:cytochrome P450 [Streptomyces marincola]ARP51745.1 cytochrome P450 [Streptomyces marincola]ARQ72022.1 hypothetical protein CAG99_27170 [Streptomyces marincola]